MTTKDQPQTLISATITFHHVEKNGDLWVDWKNEFGAGRCKVWRVLNVGEKISSASLGVTGSEEKIGGLVVSPTHHYQLFTKIIFSLTNLTPTDTVFQIEPVEPYNILGVKKLAVLKR